MKNAGALLEHISTKLHGVTRQKYVILMLVAMRTADQGQCYATLNHVVYEAQVRRLT